VLSASGLEALRFSAVSIIAFRILIVAVFAALAGIWLFRPLMRKVSDAQVALYLEEQEPSLEAAIQNGYDKARARRRGEVTLRVVDIFVIGSNPITEYRVVLEVA